jgi:hypothetical protein
MHINGLPRDIPIPKSLSDADLPWPVEGSSQTWVALVEVCVSSAGRGLGGQARGSTGDNCVCGFDIRYMIRANVNQTKRREPHNQRQGSWDESFERLIAVGKIWQFISYLHALS